MKSENQLHGSLSQESTFIYNNWLFVSGNLQNAAFQEIFSILKYSKAQIGRISDNKARYINPLSIQNVLTQIIEPEPIRHARQRYYLYFRPCRHHDRGRYRHDYLSPFETTCRCGLNSRRHPDWPAYASVWTDQGRTYHQGSCRTGRHFPDVFPWAGIFHTKTVKGRRNRPDRSSTWNRRHDLARLPDWPLAWLEQ